MSSLFHWTDAAAIEALLLFIRHDGRSCGRWISGRPDTVAHHGRNTIDTGKKKHKSSKKKGKKRDQQQLQTTKTIPKRYHANQVIMGYRIKNRIISNKKKHLFQSYCQSFSALRNVALEYSETSLDLGDPIPFNLVFLPSFFFKS